MALVGSLAKENIPKKVHGFPVGFSSLLLATVADIGRNSEIITVSRHNIQSMAAILLPVQLPPRQVTYKLFSDEFHFHLELIFEYLDKSI